MTVHDILSKLKNIKRTSSGWTAHCPAHEDNRNSLSVSEGADGKVLLHCHARCSYEQIIAALGSDAHRRITAVYPYFDESEKLLYEAIRFEPKGFQQRKPDGKGGYCWKLNGVRRIPYRLPELLASPIGATIFITEGEKDCDRLDSDNLLATTNVGGAGKWRDEYSQLPSAQMSTAYSLWMSL